MAFQMEHTTDDGVTHPQSYWKVAETNVNTVEKRGRIAFNAYHDAAAKSGGKRLIDQRYYPIDPENYDAFFAPTEIDPEGMNHVKAAYALALAAKEIGELPKQGETDDRDSFFSGASVV